MNQFSIWPKFGFRSNPYSNENLPSDPIGDRLLVGRDEQVDELQASIASMGTHPTVEGPPGVGKSSLIGVAAYRMLRDTTASAQGTLFLPTRRLFQAMESPDDFAAHVFREVAQTLIHSQKAFVAAGVPSPDVAALNSWLNKAQQHGASASIAGTGVGKTKALNSTEGFTLSGFPDAIREQLDKCFAGGDMGAIICVLDNLELLQTSGRARDALEVLRDGVFKTAGLRWVLCGSRGIVSRARSERLSGIFDPPMPVGPLPDDAAIKLVKRRLDEFANGSNAYAPVTPESFETLYAAFHFNLRDAMAQAQQYARWMHQEYVSTGQGLPPKSDRQVLLENWLSYRADEAEGQTKAQPRVWTFFDALTSSGGRCAMSEFKTRFEFENQQQMTAAVTELKAAGLVERETDPENGNRTLAAATPTGWLVAFKRNGYKPLP